MVVDQKVRRIRGEPQWVCRTVDVPLDLKDGTVVLVHDTWQDPSGPQCILKSAMFTDVIFRHYFYYVAFLKREAHKKKMHEIALPKKGLQPQRVKAQKGVTIISELKIGKWIKKERKYQD